MYTAASVYMLLRTMALVVLLAAASLAAQLALQLRWDGFHLDRSYNPRWAKCDRGYWRYPHARRDCLVFNNMTRYRFRVNTPPRIDVAVVMPSEVIGERVLPEFAHRIVERPKTIDRNSVYVIRRTGWPFNSVSVLHRLEPPRSSEGTFIGRNVGSMTFAEDRTLAALHISPHVGLLTANLGVWCALWFLVAAFAVHLRNRVRDRRGLCRRCAYNLSGLRTAKCPECGHSSNAVIDKKNRIPGNTVRQTS